MRQLNQEKEAKLKQFQDEVRRRVQAIDRLKYQQQLDKSQKAVSKSCVPVLLSKELHNFFNDNFLLTC